MKCLNCGFLNKENVPFCVDCGYPLSGETSVQQCLNGHMFSIELNTCPYCPKIRIQKQSKTLVFDRNQPKNPKKTEVYSFQKKQSTVSLTQEPRSVQTKDPVMKTQILSSGTSCYGFFVREIAPQQFDHFWPITLATLKIGSSPTDNICIQGDGISPSHAIAFTKKESGRHLISLWDNNSNDGTYLNHQEIGLNKVILNHGDIIQIGSTTIKYIEIPL